MSKEQLLALADDVDRLLSAGGTVAAGDDGLRRRSKVLKELGQKVPALAPAASAVERVTSATGTKTTPALLDLLLITRQIKSSLATVGGDGPLELVGASGPWETNMPAHDLYPLLEVLPQSGEGRIGRLKETVESYPRLDLRLAGPLLGYLEDGYAQLADAVAETALPALGPGLLPDLRRDLKLDGTRGDARRLLAICKIDSVIGGELCRKALTEGSTPVRVQALECLAEIDPAGAERTGLELLGQKGSREFRAAVLGMLKASKEDAALDALVAAAADDELVWRTARDVLSRLPHPRTTPRLIEAMQKALKDWETIRAAKKTETPAATGKGKKSRTGKETALQEAGTVLTRCIEVLGLRKASAAVPALLPLLEHRERAWRQAAVDALDTTGAAAGLEATAALVEDAEVWYSAIRAAWKLPAPAAFDTLAPLLDGLSTTRTARRERAEHVLELFHKELWRRDRRGGGRSHPYVYEHHLSNYDEEMHRDQFDPRWEELLLRQLDGHNSSVLAPALVVLQGQRAVATLLPMLEPSAKVHQTGVLNALGMLRARDAVGPLLELLTPHYKHVHFAVLGALQEIGDSVALPPLKELLDRTKDYSMRTWLEQTIDQLERNATV